MTVLGTVLVLGIDPGMTGALAAVDARTGDLAWVDDMPTLDGAVSADLLVELLCHDHQPDEYLVVVIEQVGAMPRQGVSSTFKFGVGYGMVQGVVAGRWPRTFVRPAMWKRAMGVTADKDSSRARAIDLWPAQAGLFKRKKDDGRAEAALIARYGQERRLHAS